MAPTSTSASPTPTESWVPLKPPPPGQTSNFIDPPSLGPTSNNVNVSLFVIAAFFTLFRIGALALFKRKFWWDDGMYFVAFAATIARFPSYLSTDLDTFRHSWDLRKTPAGIAPPIVYKKKYAFLVVNHIAMYAAKASILLLYLRIFSVQKATRWATWSTMILTFGVFLFVIITDAVNRTPPVGKEWVVENLKRNETIQPTINIVAAFLRLVVDVAIFVIPLRASWNLQIGLKWKLKMMVVFGTGLFAVIAVILSCYVRVSPNYDYDRQWSGGLLAIYGSVEIYVSLIVACVPTTVLFFQNFMSRSKANLSSWFPRAFSSSQTTEKSGSGAVSNQEKGRRGPPPSDPDADILTTQNDDVESRIAPTHHSESTKVGNSDSDSDSKLGRAI